MSTTICELFTQGPADRPAVPFSVDEKEFNAAAVVSRNETRGWEKFTDPALEFC